MGGRNILFQSLVHQARSINRPHRTFNNSSRPFFLCGSLVSRWEIAHIPCCLFPSISSFSRSSSSTPASFSSSISSSSSSSSTPSSSPVTPPSGKSKHNQRHPLVDKNVISDNDGSSRSGLAEYTPNQIEQLRALYNPEQLSAILAGEDSIDHQDFINRKHRSPGDPFKLPYLTDLSSVDPFLDFPISHIMPGYHPQQPVPKIDSVRFANQDEGTRLSDLSKATGFPVEYLSKLKCRQVLSHRVSNQTRLGKISKLYILTIAGDGNGMLGIGEGKGMSPEDARSQSLYQALKNLTLIPRYEERTIYGDVKVKMGAVELWLMARPPGYGARVSQYIFDVCRFAGIHDLSARVTRSRNPMNVIKATVKALQSQRLPETIARGRGKKLVDVRKVYYGRQVL